MQAPVISLDARKIALIALSIQIVFLGALGLDWIGLKIPALREIFAFIYLTFIPGILILQLLKFDLSKLNTWLYGIGISVVFLMFTGVLISLIYPLFGIQKPFSLLTTTYVIVTLLCTLLCFLTRKNHSAQLFSFDLKRFLSPYIFLLFLPCFTAIGAYFVRYHGTNTFMFSLLVAIGLLPLLVALGKIPEEFLPTAIFSIFLSLLFNISLSIPYLLENDIEMEYYYANLTNLNWAWNAGIKHQTNSLLGSVVLPVAYSKMTGLPLVWIFKLLYPTLSSFSLVMAYQDFKQQLGGRMAFLSCFFFVITGMNIEASLVAAKNSMYLFFICSFLLLMLDKTFGPIHRSFLSTVFMSGLVVSHYGVPYILIFSSLAVLIFISISRKLKKFVIKNPLTNSNFILLLSILTLSWFIYTSKGAGFTVVVRLGEHIVNTIGEFLSPVEMSGVSFLTMQVPTWEWKVVKVLHHIAHFFILCGFLSVLYSKLMDREKSVENEYFLYSATFLGWLGASIILPTMIGQGSLGFPRIYALTMIFLAPYCIIGGIKVISILSARIVSNIRPKYALKILAIFLMIFLMFRTEFVMELRQEMLHSGYAKSLSLSQPRIMLGAGSPKETTVFFKDYHTDTDVYGAKWLKNYRDESKRIITDYVYLVLVHAMIHPRSIKHSPDYSSFTNNIKSKDAYIYLREYNTKYNLIMCRTGKHIYIRGSELFTKFEVQRNKIYSNGGSVIYE